MRLLLHKGERIMCKIIKKILLFVLCCILTLNFVGCGGFNVSQNNSNNSSQDSNEEDDNTNNTCDHDYSVKITKEATCSEKGTKKYTCKNCGDSYTEDIAKLTTHTYKSVVTKKATCKEAGEKTYTCDDCGDSYKEKIDPTEHIYSSEITTQPTCSKGEKTYVCDMCGDYYFEEIPATKEHSYTSEITKKATCDETGVKIYTCRNCNHSYSEEIELVIHKAGETCTCIAYSIIMPSFPITLSKYSHYTYPQLTYVKETSTQITNVTYKYDKELKKLWIYYTGEITYVKENANLSHYASFNVVLKDSDGYAIEPAFGGFSRRLSEARKFKDYYSTVFTNLELDPNETYTLELSDKYY